MSNPYATNKLSHHPEHVEKLKRGRRTAPVQIHLMPQNLCNQDCHFCSYRMSNWKNSELFDDSQQIPWDIMESLLLDAKDMGVKAVEVTGGGEPLIYKWRKQLFDNLVELGFDIGLVTNGTAITEEFAERYGPKIMWARVSLDVGSSETYSQVRRVPREQFVKALAGLEMLRATGEHPEFRLGAGFVLTNENFREIPDFCELAAECGADNVRLSVRFGEGGNEYYKEGVLEEAIELAGKEVGKNPALQVHNLIKERAENNLSKFQDYNPCYTKDLLCVIGGDCNVYTCCTLAFTPEGKIGSLRDRGFRELWEHQETTKMFRELDPRKHCRCQCLYEKRNKEMISLVDMRESAWSDPEAVHKNFI